MMKTGMLLKLLMMVSVLLVAPPVLSKQVSTKQTSSRIKKNYYNLRHLSLDPSHLPSVTREMRGAWVATVANIDWPSEPGLPTAVQKQEAVAILDKAASVGLNAIILQIRPQGDSFFPSEYEPWSYYLTGAQGKAPEPMYDPLQFWIDAAHKRGLELHAWLNPYRVGHSAMEGEYHPTSIVNRRPDLVHHLAKDFFWLDPGWEDARRHSLKVILDVVERYDVDGIHFDDYFYPYKSYNDGKDFPDSASWADYQQSGGNLTRDDWRRDNVNQFIKRVYQGIKSIKPHVQFGISPFGIWRPGHPEGIEGLDTYAELYADSKLWINEGWLDYFSPQLYWPIDRPAQAFDRLLGWWHDQNHHDKHIWPGLYTSRVFGETWLDYTPEEIDRQIDLARRDGIAESGGHLHFSMDAIMKNPLDLNGYLENNSYQTNAIRPLTYNIESRITNPKILKSLDASPKVRMKLAVEDGRRIATLKLQYRQAPAQWLFFYDDNGTWRYKTIPGSSKNFQFDRTDYFGMTKETYIVAPVHWGGSIGTAKKLELRRIQK